MSAFLYGRRIYELMTDYWPTAETDPSILPGYDPSMANGRMTGQPRSPVRGTPAVRSQ
jgi:hypothetical protein